jgi:DNA-binding beta-propeller fold protein YncE
MKHLTLLIKLTFLSSIISLAQNNNWESSKKIFNSLKGIEINKKKAANPATIIHSIPNLTSGTWTADIAYDGENLWTTAIGELQIHQISTVNGSIIRSIPTNVNFPKGLTFDGTNLWLSDSTLIYQIDTANGNVLQSISRPGQDSGQIQSEVISGLTFDGNGFWSNTTRLLTPTIDSTFNITTTGTLIQGYQAIADFPSGLAYDGQFLWQVDLFNQKIYKIELTTFSTLDTIDVPGGPHAMGLTYDGQYLWIANNISDSIYQIDIGNVSTSDFSISPKENKISIFPNPSSGKLTIASNHLSKYKINIINTSGVLLKSFQLSANTIDISNLSQGVYFLQLYNEEETINKKFIKQ